MGEPSGRTVASRTFLLRMAGVTLVYYIAARLGLRLSLVGESVTPLWPPTGVAVVAFVGFGFRMWPAVAAAAFLVNLPISPNAGAAAVIAVGNTVAPLVAAHLLRREQFESHLERVKDAMSMVFLAALLSMLISATIGTTTLIASGAVPGSRFLETWSVWWTGDAMGVLIVAPFLWSLRRPPREFLRPVRVVEAVALLALLAGALVIPLRTQRPMLFLALPVLGWIAWRFQQYGAAPAGLITSVSVIVSAVNKTGPFMGETLLTRMIVLQSFNATVAFTSFFFAAAVAERLRLEQERQKLIEAEREAQAQLYQREHSIAVTLQRSLLPERLVEMPGVLVAARYIPASGEAEVGGDWFDLIPLPRGRLGLVIGDVAGHGISAAATMGQIRMALRAYAVEDLSPSEVLHRLNLLLLELQPGVMSTVLYAQYNPDDSSFCFSSAGHPPPLLVRGDGTALYVHGGLAPPIGVSPHVDFVESEARIEHGWTLLLYTDGLVEERGRSIDAGLELLRRRSVEAPSDLDGACDYIVDSLASEGLSDDVALLAIRSESLAGMRLRVRKPALPTTVPDVRRIVARWLADNGAQSDEAYEMLVAFGEAYTNAVRHAYGSGGGDIEVGAGLGSDGVVLSVRDYGTWRAPEPPEETDGGRGLALIKEFMDGVQIETDASGTEIRMTRRLGRRVVA